jgi:hypothetical protein
VSIAASSPVVCCCDLFLLDVIVDGSGERACVVREFICTLSKWPWCMATEAGGYFLTDADARTGQVVKWPASMAVYRVERAGEEKIAW